MVNTKTAERRNVSISCADCMQRELDAIVAANAAGTLRATGNWTPAQNLQHLARTMKNSYDGFDFRASLPIRLLGRFMKKGATTKPIKPGFTLPKFAASMLPDDDPQLDQVVGEFQTQLDRMKAGEQMTQTSPVFGAMSHDDWTNLHLHHSELHFGFIHTDGGS